MKNILLAKYLKTTGGKEIYNWFTHHSLFCKSYSMRSDFVHKYAWAIPNKKAIYTLVKHSPIIEMGAGTGYWAALVEDAGGDIIAFDLHPPKITSSANIYHERQTTFFPVKCGSYKKLALYPERTLFLCWPPYDSEMAHKMLSTYKGNTIIFVGEYEGGCTGDDKFFKLLQHKFNIVQEISIPQWGGIHDQMTVYTRIKPYRKGSR